VSARTYGIGLTLTALVVSFAAVFGLGSKVAVREESGPRPTASAGSPSSGSPSSGGPSSDGPDGRPVSLLVRLGRLSADRQEVAPGVTVWREGNVPGGPGGDGKVCVQPPREWRVDGPGWERFDAGPAASYCRSLDGVRSGTVEIPVTRQS
jgi:hypothetical protein